MVDYAYEGQVIALTWRDYRRWCDAFAKGNEIVFSGWLKERDDWLASPQCQDATRKKWFITTAKWLEKKKANLGGDIDEEDRRRWTQRYQRDPRLVPRDMRKILGLGEYAR